MAIQMEYYMLQKTGCFTKLVLFIKLTTLDRMQIRGKKLYLNHLLVHL